MAVPNNKSFLAFPTLSHYMHRRSKPQTMVKRPWGGYTILKKTKTFWVKKLFVNKGSRLSLQSHNHRNEVWYVLSGSITAQLGKKIHHIHAGEMIYIPVKQKHRITGISKACVLELAYGKVLESDIVRYSDDYGRH